VSLGPVDSYYVKSIRSGSDDLLRMPLRINGQSSEMLTVTLRSGGAQISGTVTDSSSVPVPMTPVILVPEQSQRNRMDLYRLMLTDRHGKFILGRIPPGNYKLFSWEALEPNAYYDPDVMSKYESLGLEVHIEENAKVAADLKLIPYTEP
jgi:hypothetical protein